MSPEAKWDLHTVLEGTKGALGQKSSSTAPTRPPTSFQAGLGSKDPLNSNQALGAGTACSPHARLLKVFFTLI